VNAYPTTPMPPDSIEGLAWMGGAWYEETSNRCCEEIWSLPNAHTLMGMFRWMSESEVSFYEFMVIKACEDDVEMHVKHFYPTMLGWEERRQTQAFVLSEVRPNRAVFVAKPSSEDPDAEGGWIVYELETADLLVVRLVEASENVKLTLHFQRETPGWPDRFAC